MIAVVTKNEEGKVILTEEELKILLEEAHAEGYKQGIDHYAPINPFWNGDKWEPNWGKVITCNCEGTDIKDLEKKLKW